MIVDAIFKIRFRSISKFGDFVITYVYTNTKPYVYIFGQYVLNHKTLVVDHYITYNTTTIETQIKHGKEITVGEFFDLWNKTASECLCKGKYYLLLHADEIEKISEKEELLYQNLYNQWRGQCQKT